MLDILKKLEDPKTKKIVSIVGTILIIVAIAGVFYWEASAIEVWSGTTKGESKPPTIIGNNTTGYWVRELDETGMTGPIPSASIGTPMTTFYHQYNVKENALESYINLTSLSQRPSEDLDMTVYNSKGGVAGSSKGQTADEQVYLKKNDMKRGGAGEWEVEIQHFNGVFIEYQITADVFYNITNGTANNTTALHQNIANNISFEKVIIKIEFLANIRNS